MKKLNALVSAVSLGLTLSFAVLPMASAHSNLNVGHSHTAHTHTAKGAPAHQKYTPTQHPHRYGFKPNEECEAVLGFTSQGGATIVPAPTTTTTVVGGVTFSTPTGTPPVTPIAGETFAVPANCVFSLEDNITVQNQTPSTLEGTTGEFNYQVTCTLFRDDNVNGSIGTPIGSASQTIDGDQQFATFPLSVFVSPSTSEYSGYGSGGYGYGRYSRSPLVHYDVRCAQSGPVCASAAVPALCTIGNFAIGATTSLSFTSTGNVIVGKLYTAPAYSAEHYYSDGGYYARGIRHIKH